MGRYEAQCSWGISLASNRISQRAEGKLLWISDSPLLPTPSTQAERQTGRLQNIHRHADTSTPELCPVDDVDFPPALDAYEA